MHEREVPPVTLEGWYVLHQLFRLEWPRLKSLSDAAIRELGEEFEMLCAEWGDVGDDGWSGAYRLVGGGADFMLIHFRPRIEQLGQAERSVQRSALGDFLTLTLDYLSVVELGLYSVTVEVAERLRQEGRSGDAEAWKEEVERELAQQRGLPYVQKRLHPVQPEAMPYVSFYPMNKRRAAGQNWYSLPLDERNGMMRDHGKIGRKYARRISQVISGSVGLDDWEWAVTLFGDDPLAFKDVVTEMRYDRVSAEYAEFGNFYVGKRMTADEWRDPDTW